MISKNSIGKETEIYDPDTANDEITIIDLEGEKFEIVGMTSIDKKTYVALLPFIEDEDLAEEHGNDEFTILEMIEDPDDPESCTLKTVDDEELYNRIGDEFIDMFAMDEDDE